MSVDFQQIRQQIVSMGKNAPVRERRLKALREKAMESLEDYAHSLEPLRRKVEAAVSLNPNLRCAVPASEPLNASFDLPAMPETASLLAADGSQINPDRHAAVDYSLVNVGAILLHHGKPTAPTTTVVSRLLYDEAMYTNAGRITEQMLALTRDLEERTMLARMAIGLPQPVLTLTDGPIELWAGRDGGLDARDYKEKFEKYLDALEKLHNMGASTAGYVDQPRSDLVIRLLEIARMEGDALARAGRDRPMLGVTDLDLFRIILDPYQRSAVFGIQSRTTDKYPDALSLHFFYIKVGKEPGADLARVEIPAWVANTPHMLDELHAVLVHQCQVLGNRAYPYLLHRSHEVAVVSRDEKEQIEMMIALELRKRGVGIGQTSSKQHMKNISLQKGSYKNP